jgi:predicted dehydrogenase/threonine dehydrogenase-like Zn-dependent dehydrogenase
MKQAFIKKGRVLAVNVPTPTVKSGCLKIKVHYSAISAGTEMTSVKGSGKSLLSRAIEDPSKVLAVIDILKTQGLKNAKSKLATSEEKLNSIGYSVSGEVIEVGSGVTEFSVGDKVSAGGSGFAVHAEYVVVPKNLVVKVSDDTDMKLASTGTVGSIALHGVRRADLKLGEYAAVVGTGLLGLIGMQMLRASGVKVACVDLNANRLNLAKELGADIVINPKDEDPVTAIHNWTNGYGADAVLFFAATDKSEPLSQAFRMCRRKGKVVMIGVSGMLVDRNDIYKNEIDFIISSSYGPGRYDDNYELKGNDYPYAYVRWTENRNIAAYLQLVKEGKVNLEKISPKVYSINNVEEAYTKLKEDPENNILTIIEYDHSHESPKEYIISESFKHTKNTITVGLIGAGSFAVSTLLPIILEHSELFELKTVVNTTGDKAVNVARQFGAKHASNAASDIFKDPDIDLVMICTRHGNHADLVLNGLQHGKHVFVEKPLATSIEQLNQIVAFYEGEPQQKKPLLMVGFNRRFSSHAIEIKSALRNRVSPVLIHYRMNAGFVPGDSWIHEDGGRIIGEACHLVDLTKFITDSEVQEFSVTGFRPVAGSYQLVDNKSITLSLTDGSVAVIDYFSCGNSKLSKEYMEVHFENKSILMDNYMSIKGFGVNLKKLEFTKPQKGHKEEWLELHKAIKNGTWPISLSSMIETTRLTILAAEENRSKG